MALLHLDALPSRATKADLLRLLNEPGGLDRRQVGLIDLRGNAAVVEVPDSWINRLVKALDGFTYRNQRLRVWAGSPASSTSAEDHFQRLARLLQVEAQAEADQALAHRQQRDPEAERTGDCLVDLVVIEEASGLGGRCLLSLAKRDRSQALPWTRLQAGSPVLLSADGSGTRSWRAVVCERTERSLTVALSESPEDLPELGALRLDLASDEVARQRQRHALDRARAARGDRLAELRQVLLGESPPEFRGEVTFAVLDKTLDASQQEAVRLALSARDLAIIHGPPGTGKTTTLVELIRQAVRQGDKVLACAPSNLAVDNLLQRLLAHGEKAVRLGHPARVLPGVREHTLDLLVQDHPDLRQARKFTKDAFALFRQAGKFTRARPEPGARLDMRREARALLTEARRLEGQAVERILDQASVLCATTTGLDGEVLGQRQFDLAVIDEAGQSVEPGCWVPLLRCQRLVLAGDHCQLPPTVVAAEAVAQGLGLSMLERLVNRYGSTVTRRLQVQYRMHETIMAFSSSMFYDGELEAHASVRGHLLQELPAVQAIPLTGTPLQFIDTAGAGHDEEVETAGGSRRNPGEAELVKRKVQALLEAGLCASEIAVIAPYAAQVRLLRERLPMPGLEIDSVDGFQGREKEAVVLSLVRSNREGDIGFLADVRRMNVAWTRARRNLLVIGDSATLAVHPFYQDMLAYVEARGAYATVWDEPG